MALSQKVTKKQEFFFLIYDNSQLMRLNLYTVWSLNYWYTMSQKHSNAGKNELLKAFETGIEQAQNNSEVILLSLLNEHVESNELSNCDKWQCMERKKKRIDK